MARSPCAHKFFGHKSLQSVLIELFELKSPFGGIYPAVPSMIGCEVGAGDPPVGSTVMANALASTPMGSGGLITVAVPRESGWNRPAGMGEPAGGMSHSS
jgi:hypothetical protein